MARRTISLMDYVPRAEERISPLLARRASGETERLARALDESDLETLSEGRRRLQRQLVEDLQRLVGEFVIEVRAATTLHQKVGSAVRVARKLIASQPPAHYLKQCANPDGFEKTCWDAVDGLVRFMAAEINAVCVEAGAPAMAAATVESSVRLAATDLREALALADADGVDRMAQLAVKFAWLFDPNGDPNVRPIDHAAPDASSVRSARHWRQSPSS